MSAQNTNKDRLLFVIKNIPKTYISLTIFQTLHVASKTFVYWICSNPEDFIAPFLFSAVLGLQASEQ